MRLITGSDSEDRFAGLHKVNSGNLLRYFRRRLDDQSEAADLVAEVYLVLWRRIAEAPDNDDEARAWLYGIAYGVLLNHRRGAKRRLALADRLRQLPPPAAAVGPDDAPELRRAVMRLNEQDRELVWLIAWDGLAPSQAASVLGITAGAARTRLHRIRKALRALLQDSACSA